MEFTHCGHRNCVVGNQYLRHCEILYAEYPSLKKQNYLYNEIRLGQTASLTRIVTKKSVELFAEATQDRNPIHLDPLYARTTRFGKKIAHGFFSGALVSCLLGTVFPGPGTIYLYQSLKFLRPVFINDKITASVKVIKKYANKRYILFDCRCVNQSGKIVVSGQAKVLTPDKKIYYTVSRQGKIKIE